MPLRTTLRTDQAVVMGMSILCIVYVSQVRVPARTFNERRGAPKRRQNVVSNALFSPDGGFIRVWAEHLEAAQR